MTEWWDNILWGAKEGYRHISGRLLYVIWNTWKKMNMRIFTTKCLTFVEVASIAREDILQRVCASQSMCQLSQLNQIRHFFNVPNISRYFS
jgi:hypothetical protein